MSAPTRYRRSAALLERARALIPGGHHLSGRPLLGPATSPLYFERASGARIWDVDGHGYLDYILAYGPYLLGYGHPAVDAAARAQMADGGLLSLNHPVHIRFLEALLARFPGNEMGLFFKTGSEATTAALRIARRATGRRLVARCGYHGWHDWCVPDSDTVPAGLDAQVLTYDASDPDSLDACLAAGGAGFAAVVLAPEMIHPPNRETVVRLMASARRHGALFIMDEVKTGVRAPGWSMQAFYGVQADLTTLSKALGNGWPVAATIGPRAVMRHGAGLHVSATYHGDPVAMAAAMATLDVVEREGVQEQVAALGQRLIDGLNATARLRGIAASAHGEPIPAMPFLAFRSNDRERDARVSAHVYERVLTEGILLHPRHLWFVSAAHAVDDIDRTVEVVDRAMASAARLA